MLTDLLYRGSVTLVNLDPTLLYVLRPNERVYATFPFWPDFIMGLTLESQESLYLLSGYAELQGHKTGGTYRVKFSDSRLYATVKMKAELVQRAELAKGLGVPIEDELFSPLYVPKVV